MASKADIQSNIDNIITGAGYTANQMRPLLTSMLDFSTANQTVVSNNLVANNTTSATSLVLSVGVNIITTSTLTDYACKLPQPVTGQKVTIINRGQRPIAVFPSNIGGQINLLPINTPAIVPNDGSAYDFYCIENPLPGAWVWSPPATNQTDSGEISVSHTNGTPTNATGWDANIGFSGTSAGVDMNGNLTLGGGPWTGLTFPATVTRIKVYSNIVSADVGSFIPNAISVQLITAFLNSANSSVVGPRFDQYLYGIKQFPPAGVLFAPIGTLNNPPEIGDTDTMYTIYDMPFTGIGDQIGTGGPFSSYYYTFGMFIPSSAATKTYKFRFFLEYN
jgi:hypothetical protein